MKLGAVFPQTESTADPGALREYVEAIEAMGYDHLEFYDHVLGVSPDRPGGWTGPHPHDHVFPEERVTLGFLAGNPKRLKLGHSIPIRPQPQTPLGARPAA